MFKNLNEIQMLALQLFKKYKIDDKITFSFSTRLQCYGMYDDEKKEIVLNAKICLINLENKAFIQHLILHEIVHALEDIRYKKKVDYHFHGKHFKQIAKEIGCLEGQYLNEYFKIKQCKRRITKDEIEQSISGDIK